MNQSHVLFDRFSQASTCKGTLKAFQELCDFLDLRPTDCRIFYHKLKSRLNYWKAKALWAKLDKRACHKDYKKGRACPNSKVCTTNPVELPDSTQPTEQAYSKISPTEPTPSKTKQS